MTRSELIQRITARFTQLTSTDADLSVKMIIDGIAECLAQAGKIEIRGFGTFNLNYRPPRLGRNPKSGTPVDIPEKHMPHFKPSRFLHDKLNKPE